MIHEPFPHVVQDNFISPDLCRAACAEWPDEHWLHWLRYSGERGDKFVTHDASRLTFACAEIIRELLRIPLAGAMGITDAFPDTSLYGAGMSMILPGCELPLHLDGDHHPVTKWERAASAMLYLSECDGGELQLWDATGKTVVKSIAPRTGRLVIFECCPQAWHSVAPVAAYRRLSLSLFFWRIGEGKKLDRPRAEFRAPT